MTSSLATLTKEQLEAESAAAYILTGSYRKAAALVHAHPDTVRDRARRFARRQVAILPDDLKRRFSIPCRDFTHTQDEQAANAV